MKKNESAPWLPAKYQPADAKAIQCVADGTASADQQRRAMKWIIEEVCKTYDLEFRPESERDTTLASGKRFVGLQIVKMLHIHVPAITKK